MDLSRINDLCAGATAVLITGYDTVEVTPGMFEGHMMIVVCIGCRIKWLFMMPEETFTECLVGPPLGRMAVSWMVCENCRPDGVPPDAEWTMPATGGVLDNPHLSLNMLMVALHHGLRRGDEVLNGKDVFPTTPLGLERMIEVSKEAYKFTHTLVNAKLRIVIQRMFRPDNRVGASA